MQRFEHKKTLLENTRIITKSQTNKRTMRIKKGLIVKCNCQNTTCPYPSYCLSYFSSNYLLSKSVNKDVYKNGSMFILSNNRIII